MDAPELTEPAFDAALTRTGLALSPEDRDIAFAEARNLFRAAALVRDYAADAGTGE